MSDRWLQPRQPSPKVSAYERNLELDAIEEAIKAGRVTRFPEHMTEQRHIVASKSYGARMGKLGAKWRGGK